MREIKIVTRGKRYPRKYKSIRSVSLCDRNGEVVASISLGPLGIHIDHLAGFPVNVKEMNGLGQYQLDGEPEAPFSCPHCGGGEAKLYGGSHRKWADGSTTGLGNQYRVVCKNCGKGVI